MSVPLLLYLAGTLPVTAELEAPDDAPVELVAFVAVLPLSLLEPHPVSATRQTAKIALVRTARGVAPRMFASSSVGFQRGNPTHYVSDRRPSPTAIPGRRGLRVGCGASARRSQASADAPTAVGGWATWAATTGCLRASCRSCSRTSRDRRVCSESSATATAS